MMVTTEEGEISITVFDSSGDEIFSESNIKNKEFTLPVSGKVHIVIEAEKHKGSFVIGD
jgi:hypothetical protein